MSGFLAKHTILWVIAGFIMGCASGPKEKPKVSYQSSAKANYDKGKKEYDDGDYLKATEYFRFVKNRYPYSTYATLSDLMLAECDLGRDRYLEAADGFNNFIKLHPKHKKVPYAMYRIGYCYYQRIPDDWWFAPPAYERDQSETAKTIDALQQYLASFPQDEYAKEGRKLLLEARLKMAKRVHYTMRFYKNRNRARGMLWRAEELLNEYADLQFTEEALYCKAEALHQLKDHDKARDTLTSLIEKYPQGEYIRQAKNLLESISKTTSDRKTSEPSSDKKTQTSGASTP